MAADPRRNTNRSYNYMSSEDPEPEMYRWEKEGIEHAPAESAAIPEVRPRSEIWNNVMNRITGDLHTIFGHDHSGSNAGSTYLKPEFTTLDDGEAVREAWTPIGEWDDPREMHYLLLATPEDTRGRLDLSICGFRAGGNQSWTINRFHVMATGSTDNELDATFSVHRGRRTNLDHRLVTCEYDGQEWIAVEMDPAYDERDDLHYGYDGGMYASGVARRVSGPILVHKDDVSQVEERETSGRMSYHSDLEAPEFDAGRINEVVYPENFGAVGDRETDDTDAFAEAIEYIKATPGRSILGLQTDKEYRITEMLDFDTRHIKGVSGQNAAIYVDTEFCFDVHGSQAQASHPENTTNQTQFEEMNSFVENVRFFGEEDFEGTAAVIEETFGFHVRHCQMSRLEDGIVFTGNNRNSFVHFNNIYNNAGNGLTFRDGDHHQCNVVGNHIMACKRLIYCTGMDGSYDVQLVANDLETFAPDYDGETIGAIIVDNPEGEVSGWQIVANTIEGHRSTTAPHIWMRGDDVNQIRLGFNQATFINEPWVKFQEVTDATIAFNTGKQIGDDFVILEDCYSVGVTHNDCSNVNGYMVRLTGQNRLVSVDHNVGRNVNSLFAGHGGEDQNGDPKVEYMEGINVSHNRVRIDHTWAGIYLYNTRWFGSEISHNYIRDANGSGRHMIDVRGSHQEGIDYMSGFQMIGNSVNGQGSDESLGYRVDTPRCAASIFAFNTARDVERDDSLSDSDGGESTEDESNLFDTTVAPFEFPNPDDDGIHAAVVFNLYSNVGPS